jgi:hypothetical protein
VSDLRSMERQFAVSVRYVNGMWRWSVVDVRTRPPQSIGEGQHKERADAWAGVASLMEKQGLDG